MSQAELIHVPISALDRAHNVRRDLGDLTELMESIQDVGVLTPVTITVKASGVEWYLVAGHRRVAAAEKVGLDTVPALVHTAGTHDERMLATLVENLQRQDLDPVEEANGFRRLVDAGWSQSEVARRVRRSKGHVSKRLRLLMLPDDLQEMVSKGSVTVEHGYVLSRLVDRGLGGEDLTAAAIHPQTFAEMKLSELDAAAARSVRRAVLEAEDVQVLEHDRWWQCDHPQVSSLRLRGDGDHSDEPCHAVLLSFTTDDRDIEVREHEVCTAKERHHHGGHSGLVMLDSTAASEDARRKREEEQAARAAEEERQWQQATAQVLALDDSVVIPAALCLAVDSTLRVIADDELVPNPDGLIARDQDWRIPLAVLESATPANLARALIRHAIIQSHKEWYISQNNRKARVLHQLRKQLPKELRNPPGE